MKLIFEKGVPGRRGAKLPKCDVPSNFEIPRNFHREHEADLPEVSELEVVRHFTELSRRNFGIDTNFYPLGSCTMKYNPKIDEEVSRYKGFVELHPLLPQLRHGGMLTQGALQVIYNTERLLSEITGMSEFTMQPLAGAHGELTGTMIIAAYHKDKGNKKTKIIVPDSSHGTNPASAAICGYSIVSVPSNSDGMIDYDEFLKVLDNEVAAVMLTCPNTLGLFEPQIKKIAQKLHEVDGLMYCDGANMNAILGKIRPGDIGFDLMHINLHKTFATPHGGGGPGAGPVGVVEKLKKFLPISLVIKRNDGTYALDYDRPSSIGFIAPFYGNFGVILKAYCYILMLGKEGLIAVSENAVLNANYIKEKLKKYYHLAYDKTCMHECVFSAVNQLKNGVHTVDIAKRLIDYGFHPPTIYFPLIVKEAIMIEPTETETKETLDAFIETMIKISNEAQTQPEIVKDSPKTTPVSRLDEVSAARDMDLCFKD
ncbi:MAG: aminomethyl-transferring glycine dehydrogenase subunit GcvPB [Elusimicrobia bacterium]|nr:aminomethyl-transferring glycine dehydrogenase subunit GcvPB [Elusimicrobiota bacterium]MBU2615216.1 aminomethyl-transferring glycine dehydrogenase subunit GcvPB [Elusimicrobiota bacterium]